MKKFLNANWFYSHIKRDYYVIIAVGKVSSHEDFANL